MTFFGRTPRATPASRAAFPIPRWQTGVADPETTHVGRHEAATTLFRLRATTKSAEAKARSARPGLRVAAWTSERADNASPSASERGRQRLPSAILSERSEQSNTERAIQPQIAHRRAEPGWRAAVLDERGSRHVFRLRASEEGSATMRHPQRAERANVDGASRQRSSVSERVRKAAASKRHPQRAE